MDKTGRPDHEPQLSTPDGQGQWAGHLNVGMLGLCGPEARERALARLKENQ